MKERLVYKILAGLFLLTIQVSAQESSSTDEIVIKATNAIIFQMTANLKLTQDQISAVEPIIADNIAKVRNLQQRLEDGNIDNNTMYSQRKQLIIDEDQQLSTILTQDQMRVWVRMQNQSESYHSNHNSSK